MTKINKLGKSTFVIAILSFLLVAVLAFGGTYAYFSAQTAGATGNIQTGHLTIYTGDGTKTTAALTIQKKVAQPNQAIVDQAVTAEVYSNISYYTRVRVSITVGDKVVGATSSSSHASESCVDKVSTNEETGKDNNTEIVTVNVTNGAVTGTKKAGTAEGAADVVWETATATIDYSAGEVVYYMLAPETVADNTTATKTTQDFDFEVIVNDWVGHATANSAAGCEYWMDRVITVNVIVEVLQADYLKDHTNAGTAFETGSDAATAWENALKVTKG